MGRNVKARAITRISFPGDGHEKVLDERYWMFAVLGYVLLLTAVGFALDLGVLAMMLRS